MLQLVLQVMLLALSQFVSLEKQSAITGAVRTHEPGTDSEPFERAQTPPAGQTLPVYFESKLI